MHIGGPDHVADVFRQQAVAAFGFQNQFLLFKVFRNVTGGADVAVNVAVGIQQKRRITEFNDADAAVGVTEAGHGFPGLAHFQPPVFSHGGGETLGIF